MEKYFCTYEDLQNESFEKSVDITFWNFGIWHVKKLETFKSSKGWNFKNSRSTDCFITFEFLNL